MVNQLVKIIKCEAALFESFLDLLAQQQTMLIKNDSEGLNRITAEQQEKTVESRRLSSEREKLVDEINRATPRTQAALLEAMQERQVSYNGTQHILPNPFRVIATQNPIELEGTFPLPEAQLDRFMLKLHVPYPAADRLGEILDATLDREPADELQVVCTIERMLEIQSTAQQVLVSEDVRSSAVDLILATQADSENSVTRRHIRYGASPRALQSLVRAARVRALIGGRAHVAPEDLAHLALPVLRHRILLRSESELDGNTPDSVLSEIVAAWSETCV